MITAQPFLPLAMHSRKRYGLPVAAKSATGFGRPSNLAQQRPIRQQALFLCPPFRFMVAVRGIPSGMPGPKFPVDQPAHSCHPNSLGRGPWQLLIKLGATPMQHIHALNSSSNSLAIAIIGAELIAYRINRLPEQRAHLLGLVLMADTLGALNSTDRATLATTLIEGEAP